MPLCLVRECAQGIASRTCAPRPHRAGPCNLPGTVAPDEEPGTHMRMREGTGEIGNRASPGGLEHEPSNTASGALLQPPAGAEHSSANDARNPMASTAAPLARSASPTMNSARSFVPLTFPRFLSCLAPHAAKVVPAHMPPRCDSVSDPVNLAVSPVRDAHEGWCMASITSTSLAVWLILTPGRPDCAGTLYSPRRVSACPASECGTPQPQSGSTSQERARRSEMWWRGDSRAD